MKLAYLIAVAAATLSATPSLADTIDVTFTGTVSSALGTTANSGYVDGQAISGGFFIDSVTGAVTGATLGSYAAPAVTGTSNLSSTDAIYAQGQHASAGDPRNTSINVDFSALTSFTGTNPGTNPGTFLTQTPSVLAQLIDFTGATSAFPSTVTYYDGDLAAQTVTRVDAYLTGVSATYVPLPASAWLLGTGLLGLLGVARRRTV